MSTVISGLTDVRGKHKMTDLAMTRPAAASNVSPARSPSPIVDVDDSTTPTSDPPTSTPTTPISLASALSPADLYLQQSAQLAQAYPGLLYLGHRSPSLSPAHTHTPTSATTPTTSLSPFRRLGEAMWHPHVYVPPKTPTPFSIDDILTGATWARDRHGGSAPSSHAQAFAQFVGAMNAHAQQQVAAQAAQQAAAAAAVTAAVAANNSRDSEGGSPRVSSSPTGDEVEAEGGEQPLNLTTGLTRPGEGTNHGMGSSFLFWTFVYALSS